MERPLVVLENGGQRCVCKFSGDICRCGRTGLGGLETGTGDFPPFSLLFRFVFLLGTGFLCFVGCLEGSTILTCTC